MTAPRSVAPYVPPTGSVFFPLASNAHALVAGAAAASVRARIKVSSLLYNEVLLEAGSMRIQAGPSGASVWRIPGSPDRTVPWQTPGERSRGQSSSFSLSVAPEVTPGVPAAAPYREILHSETSISWQPTLEPFVKEIPPACDWIVIGHPSEMAEEFKRLEQGWKRHDGANLALPGVAAEQFVRTRLVDHVSHDLAVGASGGWDVSVDRLHGRVIGARFASDASIKVSGIALPILVPRVADLAWPDIARIRKDKAITRLREVLREVETEALELARSGGDLESAIHAAYTHKVAAASEKVHGLRSVSSMAVAEFLIGAGAGYATTGLALLAPLASAGASGVLVTGWHARRLVQERHKRAWIGVMGAIDSTIR